MTKAPLFPIINPIAYNQALLEDLKKANDFGKYDDETFCKQVSGIWGWNSDKTESKFAGLLPFENFYYTVSFRRSGSRSYILKDACHNGARTSIRMNDESFIIPLRYFGFSETTSDNGLSSYSSAPEIFKAAAKGEYRKITKGFQFEDYVRYYRWYLSDENPIFRIIIPMLEEFEILYDDESKQHPCGMKIRSKFPINVPILGLFLCQSRFMSEAFAYKVSSERLNFYTRFKDHFPSHILFPLVEIKSTVDHAHNWFSSLALPSIDNFINGNYDKSTSYWTRLFSGGQDFTQEIFEQVQPKKIQELLAKKGIL